MTVNIDLTESENNKIFIRAQRVCLGTPTPKIKTLWCIGKPYNNMANIFDSCDKSIKTIVPYYDTLIERIQKEQDMENEKRADGTKTLLLTTGSSVLVGLYEELKDYADRLPKRERERYAVALEGLLMLAFNGGRVLGWEEQSVESETKTESDDVVVNEVETQSTSLDEYLVSGLCGIGSNRTKRFLGGKLKAGDSKAEVLRYALDAEKTSIDLQKYHDSYMMSRTIGFNLDKECWKLIGMARTYGYEAGIIRDNSNKDTPIIAIAELPNGATIAFRCADDDMWRGISNYEKPWDNDFDSNLVKIESNILELYQDEIKQRYIDSK